MRTRTKAGGGISPGGGNIPISTLTDDSRNEIIIYPNPVNKELTLNLADNPFSKVVLVNSLGATLTTIETDQVSLKLDLSSLSNGVYFIRLEGEKNVLKRIIVNH